MSNRRTPSLKTEFQGDSILPVEKNGWRLTIPEWWAEIREGGPSLMAQGDTRPVTWRASSG